MSSSSYLIFEKYLNGLALRVYLCSVLRLVFAFIDEIKNENAVNASRDKLGLIIVKLDEAYQTDG
jgi:hypothetical protein